VQYDSGVCGGDCHVFCVKPGHLEITCNTSAPVGTPKVMYDDTLAAMYNFNNLSLLGEDDSHVADLSTYGNGASCIGSSCPAWTPDGRYGGAYVFDGTGDYFTRTRRWTRRP